MVTSASRAARADHVFPSDDHSRTYPVSLPLSVHERSIWFGLTALPDRVGVVGATGCGSSDVIVTVAVARAYVEPAATAAVSEKS